MAVNLLIRDVPTQIRDALAERARIRGQSMQAYLMELVSADARRGMNLRLLAAVRDVAGGRAGSGAAYAALQRDDEWAGPEHILVETAAAVRGRWLGALRRGHSMKRRRVPELVTRGESI